MIELNTLSEETIRLLAEMKREVEQSVMATLVDLLEDYGSGMPDQWVELTATLEPGGNATAKLLKIQTLAGDRSYTTSTTVITIYDPEYYNFGLTGDRLKVTANPVSGLWECVGSYGLRRAGKADANIVSGATNATVSIYSDATTDSEYNATDVRYDIMHNSADITSGKWVRLEYEIAEKAWRIWWKECE